MLDIIQEVVGTIRRNKMRTALTGFAVAWGIFMLIVLLGAGNGLINAFDKQSKQHALNSVKVYANETTLPFEGMKEGRKINLENNDLALTAEAFPDNVDKIGASVYKTGVTASFGQEYVSASLSGYHPIQPEIEHIEMTRGRFINQKDIDEQRKVAIVGTRTAAVLFDKTGTEPLGQFINVGGIMYKVVGLYETDSYSSGHDIYIPFSTLQLIYMRSQYLNNFAFTTKGLNTLEENEAFNDELRVVLGKSHRFDPDDTGAIWIWNRMRQYLQMSGAMTMLRTAIWVIGIFTLISGIVGVSNIMLITVKERTREFGIRKALGAKPRSILTLVMAESIAITAFFGYIGMVAGIAVTEIAAGMVDGSMDMGIMPNDIFTNPTVDLSIAIEATLTLIVAGTIAGLIPARKAVKVKPIEALRAE